MTFTFTALECWSLFGFTAVIIEIIFVPGLGIFFIGLGAFTIAGLIAVFPLTQEFQYPLFGIFAFLWFGLLWYPIKKYLYSKNEHNQVLDLVGNNVEVIGRDITPGILGQVKWSGTIMNAELDHDIYDTIPVGAILEIKSVRGSILICCHSSKGK